MRIPVLRCFLTLALALPAFTAAPTVAPAAAAPAWNLAIEDVRKLLAKAPGAEAYPTAGSVVLFDRQEVQVQESGLSRSLQHTLTKILNQAGARDMASRTLDYDPLSADVKVLRCRVFTTAGIRDVDPKMISDNPDPQSLIFWDSRHKLLSVGRLDPGDAVELVTLRVGYTYALLGREPQDASAEEARFVPPMQGHFYDIVPFWSDVPVLEKSYRVDVPDAKKLQYQFFHGGVEITDRVSGGMRTLIFTQRNFKPSEKEPGMVAWSDVAPKLLLTTADGWKAKAVWFHGVQEKAESFKVTPEIRALADQITSGLRRDEDKVSALNHWVAEYIRYIGLHMGKGEGFTLHSGEVTLKDRGGVCKDKAGMLVTLLRAAGFEAYAGMTMAGERIENLAADQFNHCITVWRKADKTTVLLDPTWVPGVREMWSSREQQQEVLMGLPEGAEILTTPISPPEAHPLTVSLRSSLSLDGTYTGRLKLNADGQSDAQLRRAYRGRPRSEWMAFDHQLLLQGLDPRAELKVISRSDPDDLSKPFSLEAELRIPGYARKMEGGALLLVPLSARHPIGVSTRAEEFTLSLKPKERAYPVRIGCSKLVRLEERMTLPAGLKVAGLPEDVKLAGTTGLAASWRQEGRVLVIEETLSLGRRIFEPQDWPALKGTLEAFRKLSETRLLLQSMNKEAK